MESYPRQCSAGGQTFTEVIQEPIGGDTDEQGCLVSAGYSWDEYVRACTRDWELDDAQREAAKIVVAPLSYYPITITRVDVARCPGCFVVYFTSGHQENLVRLENWTIVHYGISEEEAVNIAQESICTEEGDLTDNIMYNTNTYTWWIDMIPFVEKEICNPACVVNEASKTAEINWRCTGALPPER